MEINKPYVLYTTPSQRRRYVCDVRGVIDVVVSPEIGMFLSIQHETCFDSGGCLGEKVERNQYWAVMAIINIYLFDVLVVGELKWLIAEFTIHENTR